MITKQSSNRIWIMAVIGLLLINLAMLFFFLTKGGDKHGPRGVGGREARMNEFLKKEVGFTEKQIQQYDTLSKQEREKMKNRFDDMRNNKERLLKDLGASGFSDSAIGIASEKSAAMQKEMEMNMLRHFADIRRICTPAQQPVFDSLFYKMWSRKPDVRKKEESK